MISTKQYAEALYQALTEVGPNDHDKVIDNFVKVLQGNGDIGKYQSIVEAYEHLDLQARGVKKAEAVFATEAAVNKKILEELNTIAGSKLDIETKVDESIIGGVVLRVDDTLIDASIKGKLNKLKKTLTD